jgi:hypothetical protein
MSVVNLYAKTPHLRGFRAFWIGLQVPKIGNFGENLPKVSSPSAKYSRFWETLSGDFFDRHCVVGLAVGSGLLSSLRFRHFSID